MTDIALKQTLDFEIINGDLFICKDDDTDFQDLNYILNLNTGDLKQYPLLGTNLITYKNGYLENLIINLRQQFNLINLPVVDVYQTEDNKLKINFETNYTIIDLSIL